MKNKIFSYIKSSAIISALIIGIIGSALWEKVISPLSSFIFLQVLNLSSSISETFSDDIYKSVASGFHEEPSIMLLSLITGVFIALSVTILLHIFANKNEAQYLYEDIDEPTFDSDKNETYIIQKLKAKTKKLNHKSKILSIIISISTIFYIIFFFYVLGRITYINLTITKTLNNIEILSPYISDHDYKMMKSKFHRIQNKVDYDSLNSEIENLSTIYSISLE